MLPTILTLNMKLNLRLTIVATLITSFAFSQNQTASDTSYWTTGGVGSITFSQVSLSNWVAGGQNSVSINPSFRYFANRIKGRGKWENSLDLAYGLIKQGEEDFAKSDDWINLVTKYGYLIDEGNGKWFYTGLLDFRTQFYRGVDEDGNLISDLMAPGYLTVALGVSYDPSDKWSLSYMPLSGKFTFVNSDRILGTEGAYGVEPGDNSRAELGSFFRAKFKNDIFESRLELFTGYTENVGEIDVNWQNALVMQLTKVLSMNAFLQLLWDEDQQIGVDDNDNGTIEANEIKARLQTKTVLGVGLTYQFGAKLE